MENGKIEELKSTNKSESRLKLSKLVNEQQEQIQKDHFSYPESDRKALIKTGPLIQYERDIYSENCQKHEKLCRSNETKELFQVNFQELLRRNQTQLKIDNNRKNPFYNKIKDKKKRIKRSTTLQLKLHKFNLFIKKIKRIKLQKQQEKHIYNLNQIPTFETQIVKFNLENQNTIDIKIIINTDFLLNFQNSEENNKDNKEIKIQVLDSIQETKVQNNLCLLKNEKIEVSLKKSPQFLIEDSEKEPELNNKSKKISFKELMYKIDLENKQNQKKLLQKQKLQQVITNSQQKLHIFNEIQAQEIIIIDQKDIIQKEEQEMTQNIQSFQRKNEYEVQSPNEKQGMIKNVQDFEITKIDFNQIKNDPQNNTSEEDSCQIIENNHQNEFFVEQQKKQRKKNINQKNFPENKSEHNGQNFELTQQVVYNQNKNKNEKNQNSEECESIFQKFEQFCNENQKNIQKVRDNFLRKTRQLQKQKQRKIERERRIEIKRQLELERERDREKQRQREIEIIRQREIDKDKEKERIMQDEIQKKIKLENQTEKRKKRKKLIENRIKFCKQHDQNETNRSKNRKLRSLSNQSQKCNSEEQNIFSIQNSENNKQQDQQYLQQQMNANQFFDVFDLDKSKQIVIGQQFKQQEENNLNQNSNTYQYQTLFPQLIPQNILNYHYQYQAISQFQVPMVIQPNPSNMKNPYFYNYFMPINHIQQQTFSQSDGSINLQKDQQKFQMGYFLLITPENFDPTQVVQLSPLTFLFIPESSKLQDIYK
ncbi:unnamed protein product [Paramecium pentaurelia]|uniref:Uncharacterized protein n=1 Tax=Paramecium pentaurelia TaxID=43138 RepID=A0A8S1SHI9_9CILI|nr:unnamed protein product [Paramecium pentaurelia]